MTISEDQLKAVEEAISGRAEILDVRMQQTIGPWKLPILGVWKERFSTSQILIKMLIRAEGSQDLLDMLVERFGQDDCFRINILPVEASLPDIPEKEKEATWEEPEKKKPERISREELYQDLHEAAKATNIYLVMIMLSSVVAAIGILNNNVAVIIGAMVMAPMLGPNVALSLATTLGDLPLAKSALRTNLIGILIALALSVFMGSVSTVDPTRSEIATRTQVGLMDIVLALTSGAAGALSFTTAAPAVLIGVAVAVALLPPLVVCGLLLGSGNETLALGALLLFLVNVICVNLAGVATFLAQGIGPRNWRETKVAKRATFAAIAIWIVLLLVLILIIVQQTVFKIFPFAGS